MDFRVAWANAAISDLEQIVRYIAHDDPAAARRLGNGVLGAVDQIGFFPRSGRVVPEEDDDSLREILYTPYRIVYEIDEAGRSINIVRVWHAARGAPELK